MVSDRFFPTSTSERLGATTSPGKFLLREFFRFAAGMALVITIMNVVVPSTAAESPTTRLYLVVTWALLMATSKHWAARRARP